MRAREGPFVSAAESRKKLARFFRFAVDTAGITLYYKRLSRKRDQGCLKIEMRSLRVSEAIALIRTRSGIRGAITPNLVLTSDSEHAVSLQRETAYQKELTNTHWRV